MKLLKVILRMFGILLFLMGLSQGVEFGGLAGLVMGAVPVGIAIALPKSKKEREEAEIRKLQIEKLKNGL